MERWLLHMLLSYFVLSHRRVFSTSGLNDKETSSKLTRSSTEEAASYILTSTDISLSSPILQPEDTLVETNSSSTTAKIHLTNAKSMTTYLPNKWRNTAAIGYPDADGTPWTFTTDVSTHPASINLALAELTTTSLEDSLFTAEWNEDNEGINHQWNRFWPGTTTTPTLFANETSKLSEKEQDNQGRPQLRADLVTQSNILELIDQHQINDTQRIVVEAPVWPVKHASVVEGDVILGGLMMVHSREDNITCGPIMPQGGIQALEAMLFTLDRINEIQLLPNITLGAHILDDCDKDTYGLEMAVDFIKGIVGVLYLPNENYQR